MIISFLIAAVTTITTTAIEAFVAGATLSATLYCAAKTKTTRRK